MAVLAADLVPRAHAVLALAVEADPRAALVLATETVSDPDPHPGTIITSTLLIILFHLLNSSPVLTKSMLASTSLL